MTDKLLPCPFCGKQIAEIGNCKNMEECEHFEECPAVEPYVCVVCSINKGGCGASTGYQEGVEKAIAAWNRRADHIRDTTKKVSNADRIRSMSDEELAEFLWEQNGGNRYWKSVGKYLDWLRQPAKEAP